MKQPVLIVGMEPRITIPIARSLHRYGIPVETASLSSAEPSPHSRAIRDFTLLPIPSDNPAAFSRALTELIKKKKFDMLIPATDAALGAISAHDSDLRRLLHVGCPAPHVVQRVLNKSLTLEIAEKCGIKVPGTFRAENLAELDALAGKLEFPVVAKPFHKSKETDFKVRYFKSIDELRSAMKADDQLGSRIMLQEYCQGDGVGVEMLIHEGQPVATFQHRRLKEVPSTGGAAVVAIAEETDPDLAQQAFSLLRALEWEGVAMVEFRFDPSTRRSALMEVNGRYWGTLSLPIHAGVDFPLYEWQLAHGELPNVPATYAVGIRWRWTAGYIRRWHGLVKSSAKKALSRPSVLKQLLPSLSDVNPGTGDSLFCWRDPMPMVSETCRAITGALTSDLSGIFRKGRTQHRANKAAEPAAVHLKSDIKENVH